MDNLPQHELKEVEEKFRKAMILNAQLDNDKASLGYQLELLKDRIDELQEEYAQLQVVLPTLFPIQVSLISCFVNRGGPLTKPSSARDCFEKLMLFKLQRTGMEREPMPDAKDGSVTWI